MTKSMRNKTKRKLKRRVQLSKYKWIRHFEHAVVTLDLEDPLDPMLQLRLETTFSKFYRFKLKVTQLLCETV